VRWSVSVGALVLTAGVLASGVVAPATAEPLEPVPGAELAGIEPAQPRVRSGEVDRSRNMRQVARLPLVGAFTGEGDYGTDLTFTGHHAIAGNYEGFTVYDIKKPRQPRRAAPAPPPPHPARKNALPGAGATIAVGRHE